MEVALRLPAAEVPDAARGSLLFAVGLLATLQGDAPRAVAALEESVALAAARGDARAEAWGNVYLGHAMAVSGDRGGRPLTERARAWVAVDGEAFGQYCVELVLGAHDIAAGDAHGARAHAETALRVATAAGLDPLTIAIAEQSAAYAQFDLGDPAGAMRMAQSAIRRLRDDPSLLFFARAVELVAMGACGQARWADGITLFAAAAALRETIGARFYRIDEDRYAPRLAAARAALGDAAYETARAAGTALPFDAAIERALALPAGEESVPAAESPATVAASRSAIHVRMLGPLEIHMDGRPLASDAWRSARPRELFLHLALHPDGRTREQIGLAFWPDASAAQLRNNFHVTLHHVRKALGRGDAVVIERERYRLDPALGTWCDAATFERQARDVLRRGRAGEDVRAALGEALALYRGDLLEGLTPGDWYLESHDHLKRLATDCAVALAQAHVAAGDTPAAIPVLERLVRLDDLDEEAHRMLLEAYAATGARARAIQTYQDFAARLQRELESEPESRTTALYQQVLRAGTA